MGPPVMVRVYIVLNNRYPEIGFFIGARSKRPQVKTAPLGLVETAPLPYTAISIKVVHEQSGKVEYERERLLGIANKLMNFQSDSQQPFALVFDFSALLVDNLN